MCHILSPNYIIIIKNKCTLENQNKLDQDGMCLTTLLCSRVLNVTIQITKGIEMGCLAVAVGRVDPFRGRGV